MHFEIHKPRWKSPISVGLACSRIDQGGIATVEITYKDKNGKRLYPSKYSIPCSVVQRHPKSKAGPTEVYMVPVKSLKED